MEKQFQDSEGRGEINGQFILKCQFCHRNLSSRQNLKEHLYIHTGEWPYACKEPGCGKTFRQGSLLSIHKRIHFEIKNSIKTRIAHKRCTYLKITKFLNSESNKFHLPIEEDMKNQIIIEVGDDFHFIEKFINN